MNARQEWHAVLDDVLEGSHEDLEPIMFSARYATLHSWACMNVHTMQIRQMRYIQYVTTI